MLGPDAPELDPHLGETEEVEPLEQRGSTSSHWLPGQDSNLQPRGYEDPRVSAGLGLSHPRGRRPVTPGAAGRGRALPPTLDDSNEPGYDLTV